MATKKKSSAKDTWGEWANHVLSELGRLNENLEKMQDENHKVHTAMWKQLAELKVRAGLWGVIGGVLAVIPTLAFFWMKQ